MSPDEIVTHLRRRPFHPVRIFLSDGSFHDVRHPEMALVTRRDVAIGIEPIRRGVAHQLVHCDPFHVTRVEPLERDGEETDEMPGS